MQRHDIIVIGASMGGVEALTQLVRRLPGDLAASVLLVLHVPAQHRSYLPEILSRAGPLPAHHPRDGEALAPGRIYVAPNDRHLLVEPGRVKVVKGPRENGHRPAVDPLFRSAALTYGTRVVGVVLTGALDCGTSGLMAVKREGGLAVVQEPRDALCPDMPRSALELVAVDYCVPLAEMGALLTRLVDTPVAPRSRKRSRQAETEVKVMSVDLPAMGDPPSPVEYAKPSYYGCPDCGGVLFELEEGSLLRFRCRTGHAYTGEALSGSQQNQLDGALWAALRALEESASLSRRLAARARERGHDHSARRFEERARTAESQVELLRRAVLAAPPAGAASVEPPELGVSDESEQTG
ncbi:chemotaxis protein CheB [Corallococcus exiguus]|uniref:chemotaxis protein CheB n=1 Tax=Corallococcus exiguus TaxID=83462 RepID=UPI001470F744|nr:chemotaxis protein CheB [Corallococcus exiguus]NNB84844.1 chemotaxis protein CheB [Corallococcus exiguus]NNB95428.1 chemotaxis protein CheB [Corallococcus exiguus]NNC02328.1 chemotaxis protein CheB [Corallococcus exiguus]